MFFTDHGQTVSAIVYVDAEGRITNFVANRYQDAVDAYVPWATPLTEYGEQAGLRLPVRGQGVWHNPDGDFMYIDIQATENFHYRPTWAPEFEIFDARRTAIVMKDWYALKDPRLCETSAAYSVLEHVAVPNDVPEGARAAIDSM